MTSFLGLLCYAAPAWLFFAFPLQARHEALFLLSLEITDYEL